MALMQRNAVCLSDKVLCHLVSEVQIKTVLLVEDMTVNFESETFEFVKEDRWKVKVSGLWHECKNTLFDNGIEIPGDIMIMGMNDIDVSTYIKPSLSTIDLKNEETCKAATEMLIARLNGDYYPDNVVIECQIKLRETTDR